ncbi:MAG: triose-phosphate isomerase [Terricaulis sp.]
MAARTPLIAGNWKMFGRRTDLAEIAKLSTRLAGAGARVEALVCPAAPYIAAAVDMAKGGALAIGGQDCSSVAADAARTGEVSAGMLADLGASYVIVGHSERRTLLGETDDLVRAKAEAAVAAGLTPIVCVGETAAHRAAGQVGEVVSAQSLASAPAQGNFVVAYEPVWCIGGDRTPTMAEIAEAHAFIRAALASRYGAEKAESTRILYGGSVGPKNAAEVFSAPGVDGALVGRASVKADDFAAIIFAHPAAS